MNGRETHNQALADAIKHYDVEGCKAAIQAGADVNAEVEGMNPLYRAAGNGCIKIVELLMKAGADVNHSKNKIHVYEHDTPLICALNRSEIDKEPKHNKTEINWVKVVRKLLSHEEIHLQVDGESILYWAIREGRLNADMVDVFAESGKFDFEKAVDAQGNTPLMLAASLEFQSVELLPFLQYSDITIKNKENKNVFDIVLALNTTPNVIMDRLISLLTFVTNNKKFSAHDHLNILMESFTKELNETKVLVFRNALQKLKGKIELRTAIKERMFNYLEANIENYLKGDKNNEDFVRTITDLYQYKKKTPLFEILRMGDKGKIDYDTGTWVKFTKLMKRVQATDVKVSKAGLHSDKKVAKEAGVPTQPTKKPVKK